MRNTQLKVVIADSNLQERESKQLSMEARGMKVILSTGDGNKVLKVINDGKADIVIGERPIDDTEHFSPLKKKLQHMSSAVRSVFDTSGWESVRWERLL